MYKNKRNLFGNKKKTKPSKHLGRANSPVKRRRKEIR